MCLIKKVLAAKPGFSHADRERGIWEHLVQPEPDPAGGEGERGAGTAGGQPGEQRGNSQVTKVISDADPGCLSRMPNWGFSIPYLDFSIPDELTKNFKYF